MYRNRQKQTGFTIVELIVVITVIAILATITTVVYGGVRQRAVVASLQADLYNSYNTLKQYDAEHETYPIKVDDCPVPSEGNICLNSDSGNTFANYSYDNSVSPKTFYLEASRDGVTYYITESLTPQLLEVVEPEPEIYGWVQISAGYDHTCGVLSDGRAFCWGSNAYGQLGTGNTTSSNIPIQVKTTGALKDKTIVQIAAGTQFTIALDSDGVVYTWGNCSYGQLGNGNASTAGLFYSSPSSIANYGVLVGKKIKSIAAGNIFGLAVDTDGMAHSWGHNGAGSLGYGQYSSSSSNVNFKKVIPVDVLATGALNGKTIKLVSSGGQSTAVITSDNSIYTWGSGSMGQLGLGNTSIYASPMSIGTYGAINGKSISTVSVGANSMLALDTNGVVYSWGRNNAGQLGINSTTNATVPTSVNVSGVLSGKTIVAISEGSDHGLVLDSDGIVYSWGSYYYGELGDKGVYTANRLIPGLVYDSGALKEKNIKMISAGTNDSFAIDSDRQAYAWGRNDNGQLGIGSTTNAHEPTKITLPAEL